MIDFTIALFTVYGFYGLLLSPLAFEMFPSLEVSGPIGLVYFLAVWAACTVFVFIVTVIAALVIWIKKEIEQ